MEVLRRCPLAIAQRLVHCAIALSTAVLDRVTKTMSVAPLLMNNLDNSKQKMSNLLSPAPPPYSWSLLGKSEGLLISPGTLCSCLIDDRLYSAILRSLSRLTALVFGSAWVTSFLLRGFLFIFNIHRSGGLTALAWLMPHETAAAVSAQVLCTPYKHAPCHFMQSHIRKVYACLAVTFPALLAEWPGLFTCYYGNTGVARIPKWESAQKEHSPATPAGIRTSDLSITSPAL